ncbi:MAG: permease-like cell division protein FtsX [Bacteroidia bacterium]
MAKVFKSSNRTVSVVSTTISIFLVLLLFGMLEVFLINARYIAKYAKENIVLRMMFRESAKEADVALVHNQLSNNAYLRTSEIISREEAKEIMADEMGEGFEEVIGINPFPYSIDFTVKEEWANIDSLAQIAGFFEKNELIREVHYPPVVVAQVETNLRFIGWVLLAIAAAFLIISITLINSTVRLTVYSKRFLVKSMQLVGATRSFIRKPFMWESILTGIMAGLMACAVILGLMFAIKEFNANLNLVNDPFLIAILFASILVLGFIITAVSSYFAINRYLNLKLEELY